MLYYTRVRTAVNHTVPWLCPTQATNLTLLISAILSKRTLYLSGLARAYPRSDRRRIPTPKHDLLHRVKRLWRFLNNDRVDPLAVQVAVLPATIARLDYPRWLALAIDWTMFDTVMPSGQRIRYQVLRIAIPRRGRAIPVLQLAYDRDYLPGNTSQNQHKPEPTRRRCARGRHCGAAAAGAPDRFGRPWLHPKGTRCQFLAVAPAPPAGLRRPSG
jgi:hypothetical protein